MLREALERATRSWVCWRRLPAEFHRAPILVPPAAGLKSFWISRVDSQVRHIKGTNTAAVAATGNTFKKACRALLPADVSTTTTSPG
jgi:hypothetical protein